MSFLNWIAIAFIVVALAIHWDTDRRRGHADFTIPMAVVALVATAYSVAW